MLEVFVVYGKVRGEGRCCDLSTIRTVAEERSHESRTMGRLPKFKMMLLRMLAEFLKGVKMSDLRRPAGLHRRSKSRSPHLQ